MTSSSIFMKGVIIYICSFWFCCAAGSPFYYFNQVSLKEGLAQTNVYSTYRDSYGFLWIGTGAGLSRFDGQEIKTYANPPDYHGAMLPDNQILPDRRIVYIAEDSLQNLWISTSTGLVLYERETDLFILQKIDGVPFVGNAYLMCPDGVIVCSSNALYKYAYSTGEWQPLPLKGVLVEDFHFTGIVRLEEKKILLSSRRNGIYLYDLSDNSLSKAGFYTGRNVINDIFLDQENRLWIAVYGKGILCYSPEGEMIAEYNTRNSKLNHDVILAISENNGNLWLGTDGGGINILHPGTGEIEHIVHIPEDASSFPANSIISFYTDKWSNLWVGSIRKGLLEIKEVQMHVLRQTSFGNPYGLSNETVISLFEDDDGVIWIGTDGGGMNKLDTRSGLITHFNTSINDKVTSIAPYSHDELLISIFARGIYLFNKNTGEKTHLPIVDEDENNRIINSDYAITIHTNNREHYYFLSFEVHTYNKITQKFSEQPLSIEEGKLNMITSPLNSHTYVYSPVALYEYTSSGNLVELFRTTNEEIINAIAIEKHGALWIGCNTGLKYFNPANGEIRSIDTPPLKSVITALAYDHKGRLWIGTRGKIWCYDIDKDLFSEFGESDGVVPNEYLARPTLVSRSGDIYMGGVNGLLVVDAGIETKETVPPEIHLTELTANDKDRKRLLTGGGEGIQNLRLAWNKSSITLRVIAKERDIFRKRVFRYYISGLSGEPVETADQFLTLQSLPAGDYSISVSCNLPNGEWTHPSVILQLKVLPPWWKSTWFITLVTFLVLAGVALSVYMFIRKKENALKWKLKEREQEVYEEKVRFLINISHELRTPLTLIYTPLKRMLKRLPEKEKLVSELTNVHKQATHMKQIIDMVLDMRKMETGHGKLHIQSHALHDWIRETTGFFSEEMTHRKMELQYIFDEHVHKVAFDKEKCTIVLSNLLSNALKFGNPGTTVTVRTSLREAENRVRVSVSDEGEGLDNVDREQLFTRYYQGRHARGGSGIGLAFSKVLVELHSGEIGAENNSGQRGATFFFDLPLRQQACDTVMQPKAYINELLSSEADLERSNYQTLPTIETSRFSLLAVEDNPELLAFLKQHFRTTFKAVYTATNGAEALEIIRHDKPDIVVSDVMMPRMDGFELCRRVKSDIAVSHIPVVLLTARNDSENMQLGYKLGADVYVAKPFDMEFLQTVLENQLKIREQIKARYKSQAALPLPQEITFSNADEQFVLKLNSLIEKHIANPGLNVAFISTEMGMSRASLYSKMKELLNVGVNDYVNRVRFEKSAAMLVARPDLSITEIATMTGFSSQRYFSTSFKAWKGVSPSEYREKMQ